LPVKCLVCDRQETPNTGQVEAVVVDLSRAPASGRGEQAILRKRGDVGTTKLKQAK
jgi:hypothetical protein